MNLYGFGVPGVPPHKRPRSRRCEKCHTFWPGDYTTCPECERPTWPHHNPPIPIPEALKRVSHALFERWLDENDRRWLPEEKAEMASLLGVKDVAALDGRGSQ